MLETNQQEYWNDVAGPRWARSQVLMDSVLAPYADALESAPDVPAGTTLVDVGCGCGATTLMMRRRWPETRIVGLDISRPMLAVARRRVAAEPGPPTEFVLGDAAQMAFRPASVTRILSRFGVMFFEDPVRAFTNMRRWLTPDGQLVAIIWGEARDNPWMTELAGVIAAHVALAPPPNPHGPGPFSLGSASHRNDIFEQAGFRLTEERPLAAPVRIEGTVDEIAHFYTERAGIATALKDAAPNARTAAVDALRAAIDERYDGRGVSQPALAFRITLTPS